MLAWNARNLTTLHQVQMLFGKANGNVMKETFVVFLREHLCFPLEGVQPSGQGTAVAQWLRCSATNRKVADSIPAGVIGIFH